MTRKSKRLLKFFGVVYFIAVVVLLLSAGKHGWYRRTRPVLIQGGIQPPLRADFPADAAFERAKSEIASAGYLLRGQNASMEACTPVGGEELDRLAAANLADVPVWDTRLIREFVAKGDLESGEELRDRGGRTLVRTGQKLTVHNLTEMAKAYDGLEGDERHAQIRVRGFGSIIGFDLTLVFVALNFVVLVVLLHALLWEPVTRVLDDRATAVREDIDSARRGREEAESLRGTREEELAAVHADAGRLRDEGRREGEAERARMLDEARDEARRIAERRERSLVSEVEQARKDVAGELGRLSGELASKILAREVSPADHERLVSEFVKDLESDAAEANS